MNLTAQEYYEFSLHHADSAMPISSPHDFLTQAFAVYRGEQLIKAGTIVDRPSDPVDVAKIERAA